MVAEGSDSEIPSSRPPLKVFAHAANPNNCKVASNFKNMVPAVLGYATKHKSFELPDAGHLLPEDIIHALCEHSKYVAWTL